MQGTRLIEPASKNTNDENADLAAICRCQGGQSEAFSELVERYQQRLFNSLLRLTGSAEDAADLAQEAFVQAYTKLDTFRQESRFYTWLYRIAFNMAMSHRRRRRPVTCADDDAARIAESTTDRCHSPAEQSMVREQVAQVQDAIDQLADDHRTIVVLREIEGCDYEQISSILEIPIGTVRSRLFRARMQLKDLLAHTIDTDD